MMKKKTQKEMATAGIRTHQPPSKNIFLKYYY